ncbi:hypothetical protein KC331_g14919 [Hortaea werneckii]|uniref:Uncharacterized protein n=1 Tax=Hortaea werneckii TaxID=91943 RepID=A0A3M7CAB4_HORWE|nr:hypothetical protein KC331_g14919 [Hortaea werneckii]KAI7710535.1 hypothetical protein KC353_g9635 [Hortaea werneckii]RMY49092.1 hypothetical protein D0865_07695 [Hortaea werneckii]
MAKDATLKAALRRHKGVDVQKEKQKKHQKQAEKQRKQKRSSEVDVDALEDAVAGDEEDEEAEGLDDPSEEESAAGGTQIAEKANGETGGSETDESEDAEDDEGGINLETFDDESESDSEGDETFYTAAGGSPEKKPHPSAAPAEGGEEDEDIPLSDIESLASDEKGDVIPHQRLTINNTAALGRSLKSFALPSSLPFAAVQSITSAEPVQIADIDDDLNRELAFYRQSLDAVKEARAKLKKEGVPFTRPADYFAEMVKSEEQMGKVRSKQVDEAARKKASADARRQRDLKKFGKAVQVAKLQERDKAKRDTLDKINALKRKRQSGNDALTANEDDLFDVALDDAAGDPSSKKGDKRSSGDGAGPNRKRQKKDERFGYGGKKKYSKSNDAKSAGDMSGYSTKRMKAGPKKGGKPQRPGKSRRAKA